MHRQCTPTNIEAFLVPMLAYWLILLDKNPGFRPIGIGETLRRRIKKVVVSAIKEDTISSFRSLQVCAGHETVLHHLFEIQRWKHGLCNIDRCRKCFQFGN